MSTTTSAPNGRVTRKRLAEQLDRLDSILDGLAAGLNEAVVSAVREAVTVAVREAVRSVLTEVLTNPALVDRLRAPMAPPAPAPTEAPPPVAERAVGRWRDWVSTRVRAAGRYAARTLARLRGGVAVARALMNLLRPYRKPLWVAGSVGVLVGLLAYAAGPWLAALVGGVSGFTTVLAAQAGRWWQRTWEALPRCGT